MLDYSSLPQQPLTIFRDVEAREVLPVGQETSDKSAVGEKLARVVAYSMSDGAKEALRRVRAARHDVGEHQPQVHLRFTAHRRVANDGSLLMGLWSGFAVGQLIQGRDDSELVSWHYQLDEDEVRDRLAITPVVLPKASGAPRIGLVGAGAFAWNVIVPALKSAGAEVVAVTDASRLRSAALAEAAGIPSVVDPPASLLQPGLALDGIVIACAHSVHATYAGHALKSGYDVLVEKPAALNRQELRGLLEAVDVSGRSLYVGHNRRYARGFDELSVATNEQGPFYLHAGVETYPLGPLHWYLAPDQGGRVLGNLTHWIDLAIAVCGDTLPLELRLCPGADNGINLDLRFTGGSLAEIRLLNVGHRVLGGREMISLIAPKQSIRIDDWRHVVTESRVRRKTQRGFRNRGHGSSYRTWVASLAANPTTKRQWVEQIVRSHLIAFIVSDRLGSNDESWVPLGTLKEELAILRNAS